MYRSHYCGEVRLNDLDQKVTVSGWVDSRRDHGGLAFLDLRDIRGLLQVVVDPKLCPEVKDVRKEYVIKIVGSVTERPEGMKNSNLPTGDIEIQTETLQVLSEAQTLAFDPNDSKVTENLRLEYRYLDIRSTRLTQNLKIRHELNQFLRSFLNEESFFEIETPILYKSTPEGARDYLVPSRVHPGQFYALPQSPQTLKQLLMIGGMDRYYQLARCFRDEDLRAERQPEFTQLDMELSFCTLEEVLNLNEKLAREIWKKFRNTELEPLPRLTYDEAMTTYGNDKPDLRFDLKIHDLSEMSGALGFKVFDTALSKGGAIKGVYLSDENSAGLPSRGQLDKWTELAKSFGAGGLIWIKFDGSEFSSPIKKFLTPEWIESIRAQLSVTQGTVFIVADEKPMVHKVLGQLRLVLRDQFDLAKGQPDKLCWIVKFPLFDYDSQEKRYVSCHHPFTLPSPGLEFTPENYSKLSSESYDLVCNGYEIAGGSLRIYDSKMQEQVFAALNISPEEAQERFGFFIEALKYGTPPHGGIAWGVDRLAMILCDTEAIRDVIAFPKTTKASCQMSQSPSSVDHTQLIELGISVRENLKAKDT